MWENMRKDVSIKYKTLISFTTCALQIVHGSDAAMMLLHSNNGVACFLFATLLCMENWAISMNRQLCHTEMTNVLWISQATLPCAAMVFHLMVSCRIRLLSRSKITSCHRHRTRVLCAVLLRLGRDCHWHGRLLLVELLTVGPSNVVLLAAGSSVDFDTSPKNAPTYPEKNIFQVRKFEHHISPSGHVNASLQVKFCPEKKKKKKKKKRKKNLRGCHGSSFQSSLIPMHAQAVAACVSTNFSLRTSSWGTRAQWAHDL